MTTALVTGGGGLQGLGIVRALSSSSDVRILVCDIHADNITKYLCHSYHIAPPVSCTESYKKFILDIVESESVDVVFPATAYDLVTLAELQQETEHAGVLFAVSEKELLDVLLDKQLTLRALREWGLPTQDLIDPAVHHYSYPLFGRPRGGWGGRGTLTLYDKTQYESSSIKQDAYIWTKALSTFEEFSIDFAIGRRGELSEMVARRRIRTLGGFALISETVMSTEIQKMGVHIAGALAKKGGRGLFNVQVIAPDQGSAFISDVNPRSGTSSTHAMAEGVNLPAFFMSGLDITFEAAHFDRRSVKSVRILKDYVIPRYGCKPKGVVFDLDDTLVDHKQWMYRKLQIIYPTTFAKWGIENDCFLITAAQLIDEGERAFLIDRLLQLLNLPVNLRDMAIEAYREAVVEVTPIFDDVYSSLNLLKTAGIAIGILTDNPPSTQRSKVQNSDIFDKFDAIVYAREHGREKPDAASFHYIAHALNLLPEDLIMIGDNYFRDGVGSIMAGYMGALVITREGGCISHNSYMAHTVPETIRSKINLVDNMRFAAYACLESGAGRSI